MLIKHDIKEWSSWNLGGTITPSAWDGSKMCLHAMRYIKYRIFSSIAFSPFPLTGHTWKSFCLRRNSHTINTISRTFSNRRSNRACIPCTYTKIYMRDNHCFVRICVGCIIRQQLKKKKFKKKEKKE